MRGWRSEREDEESEELEQAETAFSLAEQNWAWPPGIHW